jgi:NADH-quinone oxidoreductase subunit N
LVVALVLMLAGFGYKMALVPMHLWAPDTYEGASAPTTGFISGITQKGAFIAALKLVLVSFAFWQPGATVLLGLLCVVTMTVGNVMALLQKDVKRMLAYSSVAHAGNIPVGFVVGTTMGITGSFIHILSHGLMVIAGFFMLQLVYEKKGGTSNAHFRGLAKQMPVVSAAFMLVLMSYGGVPPLLGFWGKMIMVVSALGLGGWYTVLALILVLNSALSLVYYAWVIRDMYMKPVEIELLPESEAGAKAKGVSSYAFALIVAVVLLLGFGLLPNLLTELGLTAAAAIW